MRGAVCADRVGEHGGPDWIAEAGAGFNDRGHATGPVNGEVELVIVDAEGGGIGVHFREPEHGRTSIER